MRPVRTPAALLLALVWLPAAVALADEPTPTPQGTILCRTDVMAGVYNPPRLQLLHACQQASGTVVGTRPEPDGDTIMEAVGGNVSVVVPVEPYLYVPKSHGPDAGRAAPAISVVNDEYKLRAA